MRCLGRVLLVLAGLWGIVIPVRAGEPAEEDQSGPPARLLFFQVRYTPSVLVETAFKDVDGKLSTTGQDVSGTAIIPLPPRGRINLSLSRDWHTYSFRNLNGAEKPFDDVISTTVSAAYMGQMQGPWSVFGMTRISWEAERGGSRSDGRTESGQVIFQRQLTDDLQIGAGAIIATRLNEDLFFIPIGSISWDLTDRWRLRTMRGLHLLYRVDEQGRWEAGLNAEYHSTYFRLNDEGIAPGGVFRSRAVVSTLSLMYRPNPGLQAGAEIGFVPWRQIKLSDDEERTLFKSGLNPGLSAAFTAAIMF